jgi:hypothetical protein
MATPRTAPPVFAPTIHPAPDAERATSRTAHRVRAGEVPPSRKGIGKRRAAAPISRKLAGRCGRDTAPIQPRRKGDAIASAPAPASSPPNRRRGRRVRSAAAPRIRDPSASPPKKATRTIEIASIWLPRRSATRRVHTTW